MKRFGLIATLPLAALSTMAANPSRAAAQDYVRDTAHDHVGRAYHYVRSNTDGSMPELISVYRASPTRIEVSKWIEPCGGAALVSAELDFETWNAESITGGRLLPDAGVHEFAFLRRDAAAGELDVTINLPDQSLHFVEAVTATPWHAFSFDLASLTVLTPYLADPHADIAVTMVLLWPDPSLPDPVTNLGTLALAYDGEVMHEGRLTRHYTSQGGALDGGELWLDAEEGFIVEAVFGRPNHPGYTDFRLRLTDVEEIGADGWTEYLTAHYRGCEG